MKLAYQDERNVIDQAARVENDDVCFYPEESDLSHRYLASLRSGGLMRRERPDFEDIAESLLLEVMRVDDHPRPGKKDATRAREGRVSRELREAGWDEAFPNATLFANVSSGLATEQDHNYRAYLDQFTNVVRKHLSNVEAYRDTRPGFGLGFLAFDESAAYFESMGSFGPPAYGRMHRWFADTAFLDVIGGSDIDCFVWLTSYKRMRTAAVGTTRLPEMTIIDVSLLGNAKKDTYDPRRMQSIEG